jgi:hypothetical protein
MPMPSLNRSKKAAATPAEERENSYESQEHIQEVAEAPSDPVEDKAPAASEPDEFDIAAEVVKDSTSNEPTNSDANPAEDAPERPVEDEKPENPEEDQTKSTDEILMEKYREQTGASPEEAQAWLAKAKNAQATQEEPKQTGEADQDRRQQHRGTPGIGAGIGALLGGLGSGVGGSLRAVKRGVADASNAALRTSNIRPAAGLTPEVIKNRLFNGWHQDYEAGVKGMEGSMADLVKTAAAYNQLVKTSAPGRELEKIAKSRGTDIKTLLGQIVDGSFADADARAAADALRTDPHVKKAWDKFEKSVDRYGESLGQVQHNMTQLVKNNSGKIDPTIEAARLEEIHGKRSKVEQPLELPTNPVSDAKADGKSKQKSVWDQFVEMGQNGLNFLQDLFDKVATYVASKFGR